MFFEYGEKEINHLKARDKKLGDAIEQIGHIHREIDEDIFSSVIHHIIGQQISTVAQKTLWSRLNGKLETIEAKSIIGLGRDDLQSIGMTYRKAEYILDFAEKVQCGAFDINALYEMEDGDVIKALSSLKGIGAWTAEMIMLFCMQRPDILSYGDLAILRGMRMLYRHRAIDKKKFEQIRRRYSPYGSVASLYLWAIAGGELGGLSDPAPKKVKQ